MEARKRQSYTAEFKVEAVRLVVEEKRSRSAVARELGVRPEMLRVWQRQIEGRGGLTPRDVFPGNGNRPSLEEEIRQLRHENEVLRQEKEILKKAAAFFAKELR